jgi:hypothetical protein
VPGSLTSALVAKEKVAATAVATMPASEVSGAVALAHVGPRPGPAAPPAPARSAPAVRCMTSSRVRRRLRRLTLHRGGQVGADERA